MPIESGSDLTGGRFMVKQDASLYMALWIPFRLQFLDNFEARILENIMSFKPVIRNQNMKYAKSRLTIIMY